MTKKPTSKSQPNLLPQEVANEILVSEIKFVSLALKASGTNSESQKLKSTFLPSALSLTPAKKGYFTFTNEMYIQPYFNDTSCYGKFSPHIVTTAQSLIYLLLPNFQFLYLRGNYFFLNVDYRI